MHKHPKAKRFAVFNAALLSLAAVIVHGQGLDGVALKPWPSPLYFDLPPAPDLHTAQKGGEPREATMPVNSLVFVGIIPCRILDTRPGPAFPPPFGPPAIAGLTSRTVPVQSSACGIPAIAQAYSFNVTVVPQAGTLGFLTVYPTGATRPNASTLNSPQGVVIANAAIVPAGTSGSVDIYVSDTTHVILDINGYYAPATGMTLAAGSASSPSLSFSTDPTTGMFSTSPGVLNLATGGVNRLSVRADGDLDLTGNIRKGGLKFITNGNASSSLGINALSGNTGLFNSAFGDSALSSSNSGQSNSAFGTNTLYANTTGSYNSAFGEAAMSANSTGSGNSALGFGAGGKNNTGNNNTSIGAYTMGAVPGLVGPIGDNNTAVGNASMYNISDLAAFGNTAIGQNTLNALTTGCCNVAVGYQALQSNNANSNVAVGLLAFRDFTGFQSIAIGPQAAEHKVTGNGNIYIGEKVADDVNNTEGYTIRIGDTGSYQRTFIGAIRNVTTGSADAVNVLIDSNGQLGTASSSRRYKEDIRDMGGASEGLMRLRPVTFRYQKPYADGRHPLDYGLIAEEVEEVYPDLVTHLPNGEVETVQYQKVNAMLLNEVQKQHRKIEEQEHEIEGMKSQLDQIKALESRLAALESASASGR
jgi:hypothetical protein